MLCYLHYVAYFEPLESDLGMWFAMQISLLHHVSIQNVNLQML